MGVSVKVTVRLTLESIVVVVVLSVSSVEYKIPKIFYIIRNDIHLSTFNIYKSVSSSQCYSIIFNNTVVTTIIWMSTVYSNCSI